MPKLECKKCHNRFHITLWILDEIKRCPNCGQENQVPHLWVFRIMNAIFGGALALFMMNSYEILKTWIVERSPNMPRFCAIAIVLVALIGPGILVFYGIDCAIYQLLDVRDRKKNKKTD